MMTEIQARLENHFLSLSCQRAELGYPVYALEHALSSLEITSIRTTLSDELHRQKVLSREHWLLWVIVAAEIGYSYNGEEYWTSFEQAIPSWQTFGNRETIRDWFELFAKRYTGFSPTGRWAKHFSIIAWPIAHSILPRDLQGQFARHLYDLRYQLASRANATVDEIGLTLETPGPIASQRFQHFLQQTELTANSFSHCGTRMCRTPFRPFIDLLLLASSPIWKVGSRREIGSGKHGWRLETPECAAVSLFSVAEAGSHLEAKFGLKVPTACGLSRVSRLKATG